MNNDDNIHYPETLEELLGLPDELKDVFCIQCGETYPVAELYVRTDGGKMCRNWPRCSGIGIGDLCDASSPYLGGPVE